LKYDSTIQVIEFHDAYGCGKEKLTHTKVKWWNTTRISGVLFT